MNKLVLFPLLMLGMAGAGVLYALTSFIESLNFRRTVATAMVMLLSLGAFSQSGIYWESVGSLYDTDGNIDNPQGWNRALSDNITGTIDSVKFKTHTGAWVDTLTIYHNAEDYLQIWVDSIGSGYCEFYFKSHGIPRTTINEFTYRYYQPGGTTDISRTSQFMAQPAGPKEVDIRYTQDAIENPLWGDRAGYRSLNFNYQEYNYNAEPAGVIPTDASGVITWPSEGQVGEGEPYGHSYTFFLDSQDTNFTGWDKVYYAGNYDHINNDHFTALNVNIVESPSGDSLCSSPVKIFDDLVYFDKSQQYHVGHNFILKNLRVTAGADDNAGSNGGYHDIELDLNPATAAVDDSFDFGPYKVKSHYYKTSSGGSYFYGNGSFWVFLRDGQTMPSVGTQHTFQYRYKDQYGNWTDSATITVEVSDFGSRVVSNAPQMSGTSLAVVSANQPSGCDTWVVDLSDFIDENGQELDGLDLNTADSGNQNTFYAYAQGTWHARPGSVYNKEVIFEADSGYNPSGDTLYLAMYPYDMDGDVGNYYTASVYFDPNGDSECICLGDIVKQAAPEITQDPVLFEACYDIDTSTCAGWSFDLASYVNLNGQTLQGIDLDLGVDMDSINVLEYVTFETDYEQDTLTKFWVTPNPGYFDSIAGDTLEIQARVVDEEGNGSDFVTLQVYFNDTLTNCSCTYGDSTPDPLDPPILSDVYVTACYNKAADCPGWRFDISDYIDANGQTVVGLDIDTDIAGFQDTYTNWFYGTYYTDHDSASPFVIDFYEKENASVEGQELILGMVAFDTEGDTSDYKTLTVFFDGTDSTCACTMDTICISCPPLVTSPINDTLCGTVAQDCLGYLFDMSPYVDNNDQIVEGIDMNVSQAGFQEATETPEALLWTEHGADNPLLIRIYPQEHGLLDGDSITFDVQVFDTDGDTSTTSTITLYFEPSQTTCECLVDTINPADSPSVQTPITDTVCYNIDWYTCAYLTDLDSHITTNGQTIAGIDLDTGTEAIENSLHVFGKGTFFSYNNVEGETELKFIKDQGVSLEGSSITIWLRVYDTEYDFSNHVQYTLYFDGTEPTCDCPTPIDDNNEGDPEITQNIYETICASSAGNEWWIDLSPYITPGDNPIAGIDVDITTPGDQEKRQWVWQPGDTAVIWSKHDSEINQWIRIAKDNDLVGETVSLAIRVFDTEGNYSNTGSLMMYFDERPLSCQEVYPEIEYNYDLTAAPIFEGDMHFSGEMNIADIPFIEWADYTTMTMANWSIWDLTNKSKVSVYTREVNSPAGLYDLKVEKKVRSGTNKIVWQAIPQSGDTLMSGGPIAVYAQLEDDFGIRYNVTYRIECYNGISYAGNSNPESENTTILLTQANEHNGVYTFDAGDIAANYSTLEALPRLRLYNPSTQTVLDSIDLGNGFWLHDIQGYAYYITGGSGDEKDYILSTVYLAPMDGLGNVYPSHAGLTALEVMVDYDAEPNNSVPQWHNPINYWTLAQGMARMPAIAWFGLADYMYGTFHKAVGDLDTSVSGNQYTVEKDNYRLTYDKGWVTIEPMYVFDPLAKYDDLTLTHGFYSVHQYYVNVETEYRIRSAAREVTGLDETSSLANDNEFPQGDVRIVKYLRRFHKLEYFTVTNVPFTAEYKEVNTPKGTWRIHGTEARFYPHNGVRFTGWEDLWLDGKLVRVVVL